MRIKDLVVVLFAEPTWKRGRQQETKRQDSAHMYGRAGGMSYFGRAVPSPPTVSLSLDGIGWLRLASASRRQATAAVGALWKPRHKSQR